MSQISLSPNASGTGTFTIAAPNSNTNRTLTLPDVTGTFNTSGAVNEVPAGSASAPAIYPTGDTNTGIYFPGADRIGFAEGGTQVGEFDASSNFLFNSGYGSTAIAYGCRAWVNFNGTSTVAIRASGNVTSITDNGTGDYTVNFTTAMPDNNYSVAGSCIGGGGSTNQGQFIGAAATTTGTSASSVRLTVKYFNGSNNDVDAISVQVFR